METLLANDMLLSGLSILAMNQSFCLTWSNLILGSGWVREVVWSLSGS